MNPATRLGFRRLAILAASLAAGAVALLLALDLLMHGPGNAPLALVIAALVIMPAAAGGLAWLLIRGIAWVCAGFARRRASFGRPNWN
jgi:hypothetical protein